MNPAELKQRQRQFFARLIEVKADTAVASAWEGYLQGGKGVLFLTCTDSWYFPKRIIRVRFPSPLRRRLLPLVNQYDPRRQAIVATLWEDESLNVQVLTPEAAPEETFLSLVGTRLLPQIQLLYDPGV